MNVYKVKLWCSSEDKEQSILKDGWIDLDIVNGFYIPDKHEDDKHIVEEAINIFLNGECFTISQEPHVVKFLTEKFVDKAITK